MTKPIIQSTTFSTSARRLYDIYVSSKQHAEFTGGPVTISNRPGSKFKAFGGMLRGTTLFTVPGKLIVQAWRSSNFGRSDPDSILILEFVQDGKKGRINMVHVNVPEVDHAGVTHGWKQYYWDPLKQYLKKSRAKKE